MIRQSKGDGDPQNNPLPMAITRAGIDGLPATIADAGDGAAKRFVEFFTANIRNRNTRMAYAQHRGQHRGQACLIDFFTRFPFLKPSQSICTKLRSLASFANSLASFPNPLLNAAGSCANSFAIS